MWHKMIIADVHSHLDYFSEQKIEEIVSNSDKSGVRAIVTNGTSPESNRIGLSLSKRYSLIRAALGLHPGFIGNFSPQIIENEMQFIRAHKNEIAAIGEIGLDSHWVKDELLLKRQRELFEKQLELSKELNLPAIIHSRDAEQECVEIVISSGAKRVVMHCFSGNKKLIKECFDKRFMFSIPTNIIRSQHFQMMVEMLPLSSLLTETDAPFLSPYAGKENEPAFISETIRKIAQIKEMDEEEVSKILYSNYQKAFL